MTSVRPERINVLRRSLSCVTMVFSRSASTYV